jgi:general stress protein 26
MQPFDHDGSIKKLDELISGIKIAMMTTVAADGTLHSRPMATQRNPFDGELWFLTRRESAKSQELARDQHVALAYCDPDDNRYVAICGTGRVVDDPAKARALWNPVFRAWFPKGLEDPELAVLCVQVERAEYWDFASGKMVQLVGLIKSLATGKPSKGEPSQHDRLDLTG